MIKRAYLISIVRNTIILILLLPAFATYVGSLMNSIRNSERARILTHIIETGDMSYIHTPVLGLRYFYFVVDGEGDPIEIGGDFIEEGWQYIELMKRHHFGAGYSGPIANVTPDDPNVWHRTFGNWFFSSKRDGDVFHVIYNYSEQNYRQMMQEVDRVVYIGIGAIAALSILFAYFEIKPAVSAWRKEKRFIAQTSHELRTPVAVIRTAAEVYDIDSSFETTKRNVEIIKREVGHMEKMINDLFFLSRADMKQLKLSKESFNLSMILLETYIGAEVLANAKSIQFEDFEPKTANVYADISMIRRLFIILLENAMDYTPPGGTVSLSVQIRGKMVSVSVSDTGVGIAKKEHRQIFKRFYRIDDSKAANKGNSGMGLAIAKWIVKKHRGKIYVTSAPGQGSTFTVTLRMTG